MPYKDPEAQRAAQRRSYERNKPQIMARQTAFRATEEDKAARRGERERRNDRIAAEGRHLAARFGITTCYICGNVCPNDNGRQGHTQCGYEPCAEIHVYGCTARLDILKRLHEIASSDQDQLYGIALTARYLTHVAEADPDKRALIRAEYQRLARYAFRCVARRHRR